MISRGISGTQFGLGKYRLNSNSLVELNCVENVVKLLSLGLELFDYAILSTWDNEHTHQLIEDFPIEVQKLILKDPGGRAGKHKQKFVGQQSFYDNNKVRQFHGLEPALKVMKDKGIEYVLKVRTDQNLDLDLIKEELNHFIENVKGKGFFVPYLLQAVPWAIPDFYIAGETESFLRLSQIMQSEYEFHRNVHRDLFLKGSLLFEPTIAWELMPMRHRTEDKVTNKEALLIEALLPIWTTGSSKLFESLTWRGENVVFKNSELVFSDNREKLKPPEYTNKRFLMVDIPYSLEQSMKCARSKIFLLYTLGVIEKSFRSRFRRVKGWMKGQEN